LYQEFSEMVLLINSACDAFLPNGYPLSPSPWTRRTQCQSAITQGALPLGQSPSSAGQCLGRMERARWAINNYVSTTCATPSTFDRQICTWATITLTDQPRSALPCRRLRLAILFFWISPPQIFYSPLVPPSTSDHQNCTLCLF